MSKSPSTNLIASNAILWLLAVLAHPLANLLPTESSEPPKFFSLLIPIFIILLGTVSTSFMGAAIKSSPSV